MPPKAPVSTRKGTSVSSFAKSTGKSSKSFPHKAAPSTPVSISREQSPVYSKEQIADAEGRAELIPEDSKYDALWKDVQRQMGMPRNKPSEQIVCAASFNRS